MAPKEGSTSGHAATLTARFPCEDLRALFLDKDGTLVEDVPYNVDPDKLRFTNRALDGLRLAADHGFALVVVSNQSGIGRGLFDLNALAQVRERIEQELFAAGIQLAGFYFCPHAPSADWACACRKPAPGLLYRAAMDLGINLRNSWMVGDRLSDIEAGRRAGCRTVLLSGKGVTDQLEVWLTTPDTRCSDLLQAAQHITAQTSTV